jgi:prevent-host-death family protein
VVTVNLRQARSQLSKLVAQVERGGTVIIARRGEPVAKLVPLPRSQGGRWSRAMRKWLETGEGLEFDLDRSDLGPPR